MSIAKIFADGDKYNECRISNERKMQSQAVFSENICGDIMYSFEDGSKLLHRIIVDEMQTFKPSDAIVHGKRLTSEDAAKIRKMLETPDISQLEISSVFGVCRSNISKIKTNIIHRV